MSVSKEQLREIIKEELAIAHLDLINENPALLTKYLPLIQKLGPQLVQLGPALEQYAPILMQAAEMFKNLDSKDFEKVMASLQGAAGVAAAGKD
jgi:uncharacterized protein YecE (DUF72 family)